VALRRPARLERSYAALSMGLGSERLCLQIAACFLIELFVGLGSEVFIACWESVSRAGQRIKRR
jgi:hypothetical protein